MAIFNSYVTLPKGKSPFSPYISTIPSFFGSSITILVVNGEDYPIYYGKLKDRITPHVTNFFRLRLTIEEQEGKRKYKSDGAVMVGEFVCMYVCSCTVSE